MVAVRQPIDIAKGSNMYAKNLTRDEAIAMVGVANVERAESDNCEPTSRCYDHEEGEVEWMGSALIDTDGLTDEQIRNLPIGDAYICAYYYTDKADSDLVEEVGGDWGAVDWVIHHYEIR